jgi:hypothetical protein
VVTYLGTWNAATNTPTLANGTGDAGDMYICNVAGTVNFGAGPVVFVVGDWVLYGSGTWQKSSGQNGTVTSVAITESGDSLNITGSPITTSGTINIGFNGTNLQYVNGAGNLTTFPILTGYVPYTGATASVDLGLFSLTSNSIKVIGDNSTYGGTLSIKQSNVTSLIGVGYTELFGKTNRLGISFGAGSIALLSNSILTAERTYTFPDATGTIALTSDIPILTGYVPYTGATQDVDLGAFKLNAQSLHIKGTAGNGHLGLKHQSASATASANEVSLFADSLGDLSWLNGNLYLSKFITSGNTAARSYTFPNATCNIPNDSLVVHLAGTETITGAKTFSTFTKFDGGVILKNNVSASLAGYVGLSAYSASGNKGINIDFDTYSNSFYFSGTLPYQYTFPAATGTIALTSDIPSLTGYVTLATTQTISGAKTFSSNLTTNSGVNYFNGTSDSVLYYQIGGTTGGHMYLTSTKLELSAYSTRSMLFETNGTTKMTLNSSGNLGLGVTPSAWGSGYTALQIPSGTYGGGSFFSDNGSPAISANAYNNSGWKYVNTDYATIYQSRSGQHQWFNAPSGTAGNAISFTQAMTLTAAGRLLIGTPTEATYMLDVNGTGRFSGQVRFGTGLYIESNGDFYQPFTGQIQISGVAGNTTYPSYGFYGDTGLGMYRESADTLAFVTSGVKALTIASTGAATFSSSVTIGNSLSYGYIYGPSGQIFGSIGGNTTWINAGTSGLRFNNAADNTTLMFMSNAGNVGIGRTDPPYPLSVASPYAKTDTTGRSLAFFSSNEAIASNPFGLFVTITGAATLANRVIQLGTADYGVANGGNLALQVSAGNVGIGTSTVNSKFIVVDNNEPNVTGNITSGTQFAASIAAGYASLNVGAYDNGSTNRYGYLRTAFSDAAQVGADMRFYTGPTERMRITGGGALCLGVTSAYGTNLLNVNGGIYATSSVAAVVAADLDMMVFQNTGATYTKSCLVASMTATGGTGSYFFYGQQSTSTAAIKIFSNGNIQNTNNSYGAISDARLKENIKDATPKLDDLMKVKVRNYNLKGESNKQLGVISQELEAIFPNMIEESTNMGENIKIKGVKYSVFVPMLIKAVQELKAEIEILKNK